MVAPTPPPAPSPHPWRKAPPCKRCGGRIWQIEERRKSPLRWALETAFAAPDVWIFQSESGGWPSRSYQRWSCLSCGRTVKV